MTDPDYDGPHCKGDCRAYCDGSGSLACRCAGDFCICGCDGEECFGCDKCDRDEPENYEDDQ